MEMLLNVSPGSAPMLIMNGMLMKVFANQSSNFTLTHIYGKIAAGWQGCC